MTYLAHFFESQYPRGTNEPRIREFCEKYSTISSIIYRHNAYERWMSSKRNWRIQMRLVWITIR
jgi:hypothetical protein